MWSPSFTAQCSLLWRCSPIKRALVLRGGALGDLILTLLVVRALRRKFDQVNIVANRRFADLTGNPKWTLDDPDLARFFVADAELPRGWREYFRGHDLILSYLHDPDRTFETNVRACGVLRFVVGPHRIGPGMHATEQLAAPLRQLGIAVTDWAPKIDELSAREIAAARAEFPLPLLALHAGSGSPRKNWPMENWIGLIEEQLARGEGVVIIGGEADSSAVARVREQFGPRVGYAITWPLRRVAALVAGARFFGHDSGISHLAAAAGANCTVLFGPTDPKMWAPRGSDVRVLLAPGGDLKKLNSNLFSL